MQKKSKKDGILFFVKYPKIGYVKSRLSSQIDKKFVLSLYKSFVEDILKILKELEYDILICYHPREKKENFKRWIGKEYQYLPQDGKDLGERMKNCFIEGFNKGFEKLIVIGSDSPDLPNIIFMDAFHNLEKYESVIGPCKDGGFYLLGFTNKSFSSTIFSRIPWSTKDVFKKTTDLLKNECVKYFILPEWQDVDTFDDLKEFYLRNKKEPSKTSHTMMILRKFFQTKNNMF